MSEEKSIPVTPNLSSPKEDLPCVTSQNVGLSGGAPLLRGLGFSKVFRRGKFRGSPPLLHLFGEVDLSTFG